MISVFGITQYYIPRRVKDEECGVHAGARKLTPERFGRGPGQDQKVSGKIHDMVLSGRAKRFTTGEDQPDIGLVAILSAPDLAQPVQVFKANFSALPGLVINQHPALKQGRSIQHHIIGTNSAENFEVLKWQYRLYKLAMIAHARGLPIKPLAMQQSGNHDGQQEDQEYGDQG